MAKNPRISTLHDIAKIAGVSSGTISRAITKPEMLAPKTLVRIQELIKEFHYVPDPAGRKLRSAKSSVIGAVIPKTGISTFSQTISDLNDALEEAGFTLIVSQPEMKSSAIESSAYRLIERGADGLILLGEDHNESLYAMMKYREIPHVLLWTVKNPRGSICINVNQFEAGEILAKHLVDLGHKHIAYIGIPTKNNPRAAARMSGVKRLLARYSLKIPNQAIYENVHQFSSGKQAVQQILNQNPKTTAIICTSDYYALGVLRGFYEMGISVPNDVSLASFNNNNFSSFTTPSITSIDLRQNEIGKVAASQILRLLNNKSAKSIQIKPVLHIRESSGQAKIFG